MSFGRRNLRLRFVRGYAIPLYLSKEHIPLLREVIQVYEDKVGEPLYKLDQDLIRYIIGDDRLAKGLVHAMRYFYGPEELGELKLSSRKRIQVFRLVNKLYKGFVPSDERDSFIEKLRDLGLKSPEELWADEIEERRLCKIRSCDPLDLLKVYNYEVIDTIFTNSSKAEVIYEKGPYSLGLVTKELLSRAKRFGLIYDVRLERSHLKVILEGPLRLFGRPTKYGNRICHAIYKAIPLLYKCKRWSVYAFMSTGRRTLRVLVLSHDVKPELSMPSKEPPPIYDSAVEERIAHSLRALGFDIEREPEPIVLGNTVLIPDFMISRDGFKAYVEVAGYWRKEYAIKKAYKVTQALKLGIPLIVLAEEKLKGYLPKDSRIIYYSMRGARPLVPYGKLVMEFRKMASKGKNFVSPL